MKKDIKTVVWVSVLMLVIFLLVKSCNDNYGEEYIGIYQLDIERSELGSYIADSNTLRQFTLTIDKNRLYSYSSDQPFIYKQSGSWVSGSYDAGRYCYLLHSTNVSQWYDEVYRPDDSSICIVKPRPKNDSTQVSELYFVRVLK